MSKQPLIIDLDLSDTDYLELLAQGRDPVKAFQDKLYERELIGYGFATTEAQQVATLFDKLDCSIAEKILVNHVLKQLWKRLTRQAI